MSQQNMSIGFEKSPQDLGILEFYRWEKPNSRAQWSEEYWDHNPEIISPPFPKPGADKYLSDFFFEEPSTAVFDHQNNMAPNPCQVDGGRALYWAFKWTLTSLTGPCKSLLGLLWKGTPDCVTQTTEMCCPMVLGGWKSKIKGHWLGAFWGPRREGSVPFSSACGWPSPCSQDVLTLSSHCPPFVCISMSIPPFHKDISHID